VDANATPDPEGVNGAGNVANTTENESKTSIGPPQHKRVYQACIPCRRRKVKCDLGSVDNPGDPPCVRCRRESKECFFSATRRKRKADEEIGQGSSLDGYEGDSYIVRNGRKRLNSSAESMTSDMLRTGGMLPPTSAGAMAGWTDRERESLPLTPGGSVGRTQPLRRPDKSEMGDGLNTQLENPEAQDVMRKGVYGPHDALDLLYKATNMLGSPENPRVRSLSESHHEPKIGAGTPTFAQRVPVEERIVRHELRKQSMGPPPTLREPAIDPSLGNDGINPADRIQEAGYKEALQAWARFRFVRAGWFTPSEAIDYIEYYYKYLSPLTPISPPTFRDPGTHPTLLIEEPILTVTLLTIATRYRRVPGPGGHCRSHAIHEQLWTYLRGMIERCLWGQEAFGGGFCGSGTTDIHEAQSSSTAPWRGLRKGSLRTLGTVESLMILTEWHPRALHFPPAEATDELMLPDSSTPNPFIVEEEGAKVILGGVGGKRIESWLEPAWRSDRMCWMLLSTGMGLSYELGVFDKIDEMLAAGGDMARPEYEDEGYRLRAGRIKRLLLIYVTQLAGRLGWTNMVPEHLRTEVPTELRKRRYSQDFNSPGTNVTGTSTATFNYIPDLEVDDQIIHCWSGITAAMRIGNEKLFRSRKHTTDIIQNGKYIELLKDFQPMLQAWQKDFSRFTLPPYIRHILTIEYEYVRIYVNSLSLQAVVERSTANASNNGTAQGGTANGNQGPLSPETQSYYGKLPLARLGGFGAADQEYVREVVDGSRNLLRTVVEGLLPGDYLKHAPVRTYFRIISGAMFLLKTFALGASKNDVALSIGLMDDAVNALRTCVVDDVHLGIRFADLLETLTSRLRTRFMHAPTGVKSGARSPTAGNEPSRSGTPRAENKDARTVWSNSTSGFEAQNAQGETFFLFTKFVGKLRHTDITVNRSVTATPFDANSPTSQRPFYPGNYPTSGAPNPLYNNNPPASTNPAEVSSAEGYASGPDDWTSGNDLWYLPPGAAFFQNQDQSTIQTAEGVTVGGMDLLDFMMEPFPNTYDGHGF
jgi:hypothetical protein